MGKIILLASVCGVALLYSPAAAAQASASDAPQASESGDQADTSVTQDIVVTAQRREQSLQDVPAAITAFSSTTLDSQRVVTVADLSALAPGLGGDSISRLQPQLSARGIASNDFTVGGDTPLGIYLDEVYIGRAGGSLSGLIDVKRVEVLKGPQGTLFGRNTTAGAISIIRERPGDDVEAQIKLGYGSRDLVEAQGIVNLPIVEDRLLLRASAAHSRQDGYIRNLTDGDSFDGFASTALRLALRHPGTVLDLTATLDWAQDRSSAPGYRSRLFTPPGTGFYETRTSFRVQDLPGDRDALTATVRAEISLPFASLTSITAYREYDLLYQEDSDGSPFNLLSFRQEEKQKAYSQEVRLNSNPGGRLIWVLGGSASYERIRSANTAFYDEEDICRVALSRTLGVPLPGCSAVIPIPGFVGQANVGERNEALGRFESYGIFGDATFAVTDRLNLTAGVRWSYDRKKIEVDAPLAGNVLGLPGVLDPTNPNGGLLLPGTRLGSTPLPGNLATGVVIGPDGIYRDRESWSSFTPRFVIDYRLGDDLLTYVSASRGFTSGGFNITDFRGGPYRPESIWSYEAGIKGDVFDRRVSFDLAGFYYRYSDLQVAAVDPTIVRRNAAKARGYGLEASVRARPIDGLEASVNLSLLDAKYQAFQFSPTENFAGNRLLRAPEYSGSAILAYSTAIGGLGKLRLESDVRFFGEQFFDASNDDLRRQAPYALLGARATLTVDSGLSVSFWARNLLDKKYLTFAQVIEGLALQTTRAGPPRTLGIELTSRF